MTLTSEERAAEVLADHGDYHVNDDYWTVCLCGYVAVDDDDGSHARHVAAALSAAGCLRDDRERCTCPYIDPRTWISADCPVHLRDDREGETVAAVTLSTPERLKISAVVHQNYYMPDVFAVVEEIIAERNATTTDWSPVTP